MVDNDKQLHLHQLRVLEEALDRAAIEAARGTLWLPEPYKTRLESMCGFLEAHKANAKEWAKEIGKRR